MGLAQNCTKYGTNSVFYSPGGIVLSVIQQSDVTIFEYLRVPGCRSLHEVLLSGLFCNLFGLNS